MYIAIQQINVRIPKIKLIRKKIPGKFGLVSCLSTIIYTYKETKETIKTIILRKLANSKS